MKVLLNRLRYIGYLVIIIVDCGITFLSMMSLGHNILAGFGLGALGVVIVLLMTWVFLRGIRVKGLEKGIYLFTWIVCCILIISLNWGFTRQNISSQSTNAQTSRDNADFDRKTKRDEIESTQKQIAALIDKLDKVNVWRESDRKAIDDDIKTARARLADLRKPIEHSTDSGVSALSVFDKIAEPFGWKGQDVSNWWWLIAFVAMQLLAVIVAPKGEDDAAQPKRKAARKPVDLAEWIERWVNTNWMSVRNPTQAAPYSILPVDVFMRYLRTRWRAFPLQRYRAIGKAAQGAGVIDGTTIIEENEKEAITKIKEAMK